MTATDTRTTAPPTRTVDRFRPDIEGLRAVAVLLVVLSHAGLTAFAGGYVGVDVFFVISGFLITSLLLREVATTGRLSLRGFYARRALRLLPVSCLVLLATLAGARIWLTPLRTGEFARDALSAAAYVANWRFAVTGTDYLSADQPPSPFQHFWSLAVEEQFYLIWPLLILLAVRLRRRALAPMLAVLVVASFGLSITETQRSAPWAYFGAHTRIWELGLGALLALAAGRLTRLRRSVRVTLGWAGLGAILLAAVRFGEQTAYPGWPAVLPVAGAVAVIAAGLGAPVAGGAGVLLGRRPMLAVGRLSYGWYLWHWPVLLIGPAALGVAASTRTNLLLAAAALGLAWFTYRVVENPIRHATALRRRPWRAIGMGAGLTGAVTAAAVLVALMPIAVPVGRATADLAALVSRSPRPAEVLAEYLAPARTVHTLPANVQPPIDRVAYDRPRVYDDECIVESPGTRVPQGCVYGDTASATTVVLLGDSHAAQWFPAMQRIAGERHWRLLVMTKSACTAADLPIMHDALKREYTQCQAYHRDAIAKIKAARPALVVVGSSYRYKLVAKSPSEEVQWQQGWDRTFADLRDSGAPVAAIMDTPYMRSRVPGCIVRWSTKVTRCGSARADAVKGGTQRRVVEAYRDKGVTVIDPVPWLCASFCPAVLGNVIVYRDSNHLSTAFATLLTPLLDSNLPR